MDRFKILKNHPSPTDKKLKSLKTYKSGYGIADIIESDITTMGYDIGQIKIYITNGGYVHVYVVVKS